jgi:SAM-dependent methyltransferase
MEGRVNVLLEPLLALLIKVFMNILQSLTSEQQLMERRYNVPYNWCMKEDSRAWRQKNGTWNIARELSGPLAGKKVLDAGCGDGWYTARMAEESNIVTGIDYSEHAVAFARLITTGATFDVGSLVTLPYGDETFDVIFSFQVLEHIPPADLQRAVGEVYRVLKPGGVFIASVPSTLRPFSKAHFQHFTPQTFREVLTVCFKMESMVGQEHHTWVLHAIERVLDNRIWKLPRLAARFHKGLFLRHFNRTTSSKGYNLLADMRKS